MTLTLRFCALFTEQEMYFALFTKDISMYLGYCTSVYLTWEVLDFATGVES